MGLFGPPDVDKLKAKRDVLGLAKALGYEKSRSVREGAALALGQIGDPRAVEPLIGVLGTYADLGAAAADALGSIGDPRSVQPLIAVLQNDDAYGSVRIAAASALGRIGDGRAVEALVAALTDKRGAVRAVAAEALRKLAWRPGENEDGANYRIALRQWDWCVQIGAAAVQPLIAALGRSLRFSYNEPDEESAGAAAAHSLGEIRDARAIGPLIAVLKDRRFGSVYAAAIEALVHIGAPAVEAVGDRLGGWEAAEREAAALVLMRIGDARAAEPLGRWFSYRSGDTSLRREAARFLGRVRDPHSIEPLTEVASDSDDNIEVRRAAVEALGKIHDPRCVGSLMKLLGDNTLGDLAARTLATMGTDAIEPLVAELAHSGGRKAAREVLQIIGAPAVEQLKVALRSQDEEVRRAVAETLDRLRWQPDLTEAGAVYWVVKGRWDKCVKIGPAAIEPLTVALGSKDHGVREAAAAALEKLRWQPDLTEAGAWYWVAKGRWDKCVEIGPPAVGMLIALLGGPDRATGREAAQALVRIYQSGQVTDPERSRILEKRLLITRRPVDESTHADSGSAASDCVDRWDHTDQPGFGVDFPL